MATIGPNYPNPYILGQSQAKQRKAVSASQFIGNVALGGAAVGMLGTGATLVGVAVNDLKAADPNFSKLKLAEKVKGVAKEIGAAFKEAKANKELFKLTELHGRFALMGAGLTAAFIGLNSLANKAKNE